MARSNKEWLAEHILRAIYIARVCVGMLANTSVALKTVSM